MRYLPVIILLTVVMTPVIYNTLKTFYYPYGLMRDFKREQVPKAMVQTILNKFGAKKVSELRNIKIVIGKDGKKHYYIECFVLDTTTYTKWNNPEGMFLFHFTMDANDNVEYVSHKRRNTWDIGQLVPEDTDAVLQMTPAVPGAVRESITKKFAEQKCTKNYCDIRACQPTANNSVMCKDVKVRTNRLEKPIFEIPKTNGEYQNIRNEWQSNKQPIGKKYNSKHNMPEISAFIQPNFTANTFSNKLRYDLDHNPNRVPINENDKRITKNLIACNAGQYA